MKYAIVSPLNVYNHLFTGAIAECDHEIKKPQYIGCKMVAINQ